ncbi:DUF4357 domain-containing protein [Hymenobacter sp. M29]|uniref:DUF4357 domain-containing protein n=1 Tax=Hymenobacter mellowenesis TaxID=3063995 RepID=A0ABT9AB92_9BACT|nr:DUF4357 domain-containing protein [Hymenobacter sp. M29]MDO7846662.1 DUF4357 domain-containing protein [Hymenobacter sp. M29]
MHEILLDIRQRLLGKQYKNEEHVRLSLVARLVQALGWDIWNPTEVFTEFKATKKEDNTRVDMALFTHGFDATAIFIECKGVGNFAADLPAVERQLRDYNRDHTALFTIITDGRHWRFYFSFTSGEFKDKLFCKFDLQQDGLEEIAGYLETFLLRENIENHSARQKAEAYLMLGKKERAMQDVLPDAQKLVSLPPFPSLPEAMVQLLAAKVLIVTPAEAQAFLMGTALETIAEPIAAGIARRPNNKPTTAPPKSSALVEKPSKQPVAAATPVPGKAAVSSAHAAEPVPTPIGEPFALKQGTAHATAYLQADGSLRVTAGSVVAATAAASLSAGGLAARQKLADDGVLQLRDGQLVFAVDWLFSSANRAAEVVVARSVNGQLAWKHASGKQVRDFTSRPE